MFALRKMFDRVCNLCGLIIALVVSLAIGLAANSKTPDIASCFAIVLVTLAGWAAVNNHSAASKKRSRA